MSGHGQVAPCHAAQPRHRRRRPRRSGDDRIMVGRIISRRRERNARRLPSSWSYSPTPHDSAGHGSVEIRPPRGRAFRPCPGTGRLPAPRGSAPAPQAAAKKSGDDSIMVNRIISRRRERHALRRPSNWSYSPTPHDSAGHDSVESRPPRGLGVPPMSGILGARAGCPCHKAQSRRRRRRPRKEEPTESWWTESFQEGVSAMLSDSA